jgi:uncharacterized protein (DUF305 family)
MRWYSARWRRPLLLAVVLTIALFFAPSMVASAVPRGQSLQPMNVQPLEDLSGEPFDQALLAQMTMHHAMGIMMTQPVITGGAHQDLKALGAQMIADQSREIGQMRGWLQTWYGRDIGCPMVQGAMPGWMPGPTGEQPGATPMRPGGMMPGPGMATMPGMPMTGMPATGMPMRAGFWSLPPDQLDATFMTWMIAHHQGAIDMAALAGERAVHQEVKDLAASIVTSQSTEIQTMQGWLNEWYGR